MEKPKDTDRPQDSSGVAGARGHIAFLDGLRGIAVLLVIMVHVNGIGGNAFGQGGLDTVSATVFGVGWIGVDLFFVLSGFLITGILYDTKGSSHYFRNFYMRRALRIMPLYFGYLFLVAVVLRPWFSLTVQDLLSLILYYYNFRVAMTEIPQELCHIFWSLCIEEHFYLFWPFFVFSLQRRSLEKLCLFGIVSSFLLRSYVISAGYWLPVAYLITPCRLDGLLMGALLALSLRRSELTIGWVWRAATTIAFVSLVVIFFTQGHFYDFIDIRRIPSRSTDSSVVLTLGLLFLAILFAGMLFSLLQMSRSTWPIRVLENRFLMAVGKYSYGIYILHVLVLKAWEFLLHKFFGRLLSLPNVFVKLISFVVVAQATLMLAALVYHIFEEPFLKLKSRFKA